MPAIAAIHGTDEGLAVSWNNGKVSHFSWFWLRDHDQSPQSLDPVTLQRRVNTFDLDENLRGSNAKLTDAGRALTVAWPGESHDSRYPAEFLAAVAGVVPSDWDTNAVIAQHFWSGKKPLQAEPPVRYADIDGQPAGMRTPLERLQRDGFVVMTGVPTDESGARAFFSRFGYIRETIFGGLWSLSAEISEHDDSAYSTQYLEPHTDATYSHDAPGLQCFLCQEFDGTGGESILVDGLALAEQMQAEQPALFETLCEVSVPGRYIEAGQHLRAQRPAIRRDSQGRLLQLSFNNYDRAPFYLEPEKMQLFYRAYRDLHSRIVARENWHTVPLRPGMALIFDNWRLLHGRMAYTGKRVFSGCYQNREDFESALRTLGTCGAEQ